MPQPPISEREALARAAYGRTTSPESEARAADAARALHELDLRVAAERQALHRAALDEAAARERRAHRIRSRTVRVLGTLAVLGVIAGGAAMFLAPHESRRSGDLSLTSTVTREPRVDPRAGTAVTTPLAPVGRTSSGSAASAEHWFDEPQRDTDVVAQLPDDLDPASTRAVESTVEGWQVFVAKDTAGGFCVIARETASGSSGTSCLTPERFTSTGILLTAGGPASITVYWDGFDLTTEPAVSR